MPQIRCPNCGTSINLETRRETDLSLILNSLRSGPKTFTQLLQTTRLPRKTLSLRLKELVNSEVIAHDGGYRLNGALPPDLRRKMSMKRTFQFSRKNMMLMLLVFCMGILLAQAYGQFMSAPPPPTPSPTKPTVTETFTVNFVIYDAAGLCAWQARVVFDPKVLIVTNIVEGAFLKEGKGNTLFVAATKIVEGIFSEETLSIADPFTLIMNDEAYLNSILLGCTLIGETKGVTGGGVLATVTFGVIGEGSHELQIADVLALGVGGVELQGYSLTQEIVQG